MRAENEGRMQSFGRGGMGNMSRSRSRGPSSALAQENAEIAAARSRSASRDPDRRSQSKDKHTVVSGFLHKVLHQHPEENPHPNGKHSAVSSTHKSLEDIPLAADEPVAK